MCGIIGITKSESTLTTNGTIGRQIYDALTRLEYRGYDSVGIAVIEQNDILIRKDKGAIGVVGKELNFASLSGRTAIGHSRWATHGPPSMQNAHPHRSKDNDVVVVHNGIIENFIELRNELIDLGYEFQSQTDTEVIPHFISNQLKKGKSMVEAIQTLVKSIHGTYAIVISHIREPNKIYALKKDNPLVLGVGPNVTYCASDIPAFLPWTDKLVTLKDNELAILDSGDYKIINLSTGNEILRKMRRVTWTAEAAQKAGFPHFMLKEIHEQPKVLQTQLSTQNKEFETLGKILFNANKIILVAAGTAYYAALNAHLTFSQYGGPMTIPTIAAEWDTVKHLVDDGTVILSVSQSGETLDTIKAIKDAKEKNATITSVVNVTGSSITELSDHVAYIHAGPEIGVAATKTFSAQSLAIWRTAYNIASLSGKLDKSQLGEFQLAINDLPSQINKFIKTNEAKINDLSRWFQSKSSSFYLGRGVGYISALEGALKMKEISYIHAEAYPAGESKHGPIALVEKDFPIVFSIPNDGTRQKMMGSVQEMNAREARTIGIIEESDNEMKHVLDNYFEISSKFNNYLSPIMYNIPQQLLAYYTSTNRGYNPDMPRNLAKSVTVE